MSRIAAVAVIVAGAFALASSHLRILADPQDLRAFYCAGKTVFAHHDPYLAEPLRTCENVAAGQIGLKLFPHLALPAPLPAYAFPIFGVLSLAPFDGASSLFAVLTLTAIVLTTFVLRRLVETPIVVLVACLMLSEGVVSMLAGQIVPFAVLALCASALELKRERYTTAAVYAACAAIEPHLAFPVYASLWCAVPATRKPLVLCAAALAAIAVLAVGFDTNVEYLTRVLPAHARSELGATGQYGLSTLSYRLGAGAGLAAVLGNVSYAAMCAAGTIAGRRLAERYASPELVVLLPPAFAVFGGPFVHTTQIAVAIPALFVLADRVSPLRAWFATALGLLAIPWPELTFNPATAMYAAIVIVALLIARFVGRFQTASSVAFVFAGIAIGGAVDYVQKHAGQQFVDPTQALLRVDGPSELAEATWSVFVTSIQNQSLAGFAVSHAPAWMGLALTVAAACAALRPLSARAQLEPAL